jgi:hypothetical protein
MTSLQHHYPFFLDMEVLNRTLFDLNCKAVIVEGNTNDGDTYLAIRKMLPDETNVLHPAEMKIGYHEFLMVNGQKLYCWRKYEDGLLVRQFNLDDDDPRISMLSEFIETIKLNPGVHPHPTQRTFEYFVTFWRKDNLVQKENLYEKYVIVHMHHQEVSIIPFGNFNESGGDPLYMWPALATLDAEKGIIYGHGMRMGSFEVAMIGES